MHIQVDESCYHCNMITLNQMHRRAMYHQNQIECQHDMNMITLSTVSVLAIHISRFFVFRQSWQGILDQYLLGVFGYLNCPLVSNDSIELRILDQLVPGLLETNNCKISFLTCENFSNSFYFPMCSS